MPSNFYEKYPQVFQHQVIELKNFDLVVDVFDYIKENSDLKPEIERVTEAVHDVEVWSKFCKMDDIKYFIYELYLSNDDKPLESEIYGKFENKKISKLKPDTVYRIRCCVEYKSGYRSRWTKFEHFRTFACKFS